MYTTTIFRAPYCNVLSICVHSYLLCNFGFVGVIYIRVNYWILLDLSLRFMLFALFWPAVSRELGSVYLQNHRQLGYRPQQIFVLLEMQLFLMATTSPFFVYRAHILWHWKMFKGKSVGWDFSFHAINVYVFALWVDLSYWHAFLVQNVPRFWISFWTHKFSLPSKDVLIFIIAYTSEFCWNSF